MEKANEMMCSLCYELDLSLVQESCGFSVPFYEYKGQWSSLAKWAGNTSEEQFKEYWEKKNMRSLDWMPTGILPD